MLLHHCMPALPHDSTSPPALTRLWTGAEHRGGSTLLLALHVPAVNRHISGWFCAFRSSTVKCDILAPLSLSPILLNPKPGKAISRQRLPISIATTLVICLEQCSEVMLSLRMANQCMISDYSAVQCISPLGIEEDILGQRGMEGCHKIAAAAHLMHGRTRKRMNE